jgi:uncharacterized protein (DUF2249 family)
MRRARAETPITATDRVSDVLARDEGLVEVFIRHSAHFEKLRNVAMRRVMARLVTVGQAARIADVPAESLVRELNDVLHIASGEATTRAASAAEPRSSERPVSRPASLREVELDVRQDMRAGREPFSRIMAAVATLGADEILRLRTIFEPVPLFEILAKRDFSHESERCSADDWSIWFWHNEHGSAPHGSELRDVARLDVPVRADADCEGSAIASDGEFAGRPTVWLDVRGLEPPEPLVRTLATLEQLPHGHELVHINARVPQLLLPMLVERGFACVVDNSQADRVLVRIWRAGSD